MSHPVGFLTVDVEKTVTRKFVACSLCEVDCEVPIPVSKGIGLVVERRLEARTLEPGDRASHIGDLENRLEPRDQPSSGHEFQLAVSLSIQPGEAVVADRQVGMRASLTHQSTDIEQHVQIAAMIGNGRPLALTLSRSHEVLLRRSKSQGEVLPICGWLVRRRAWRECPGAASSRQRADAARGLLCPR